jgi:zinc protease
VTGSPEDLETGLQLAHLLLTEPRIEETALKQWKELAAQAIEQRRTSVEAQMGIGVERLLSGGDVRLRPLRTEDVERVERLAAQQWLERIMANGPLEVAIVGDMPRERMMELALTYLGSLPARPDDDPELDELRQVKEKQGPLAETVHVDTVTPRAVVRLGWRGAWWTETVERRTLSIASRILQTRLRKAIREERGLTYTIFSFSRAGQEWKNMGFLATQFTADPEKADEAARIAREVIEEFAQEGPTDEELAAVRKQLANIIETAQKEPTYWASVLSDMDLHGTVLHNVATAEEAYTTYTREQILNSVREHVKPDRYFQVIALPKADEESDTDQE